MPLNPLDPRNFQLITGYISSKPFQLPEIISRSPFTVEIKLYTKRDIFLRVGSNNTESGVIITLPRDFNIWGVDCNSCIEVLEVYLVNNFENFNGRARQIVLNLKNTWAEEVIIPSEEHVFSLYITHKSMPREF